MSAHDRPVKEVCRTTRKVSFRTRKNALTGAARTSAFLGKKLRVYKCESCRRWHLTSRIPIKE